MFPCVREDIVLYNTRVEEYILACVFGGLWGSQIERYPHFGMSAAPVVVVSAEYMGK